MGRIELSAAQSLEGGLIVGADLPVRVELGPRQRAGEVEDGILAVRLDHRGQHFQGGWPGDAGLCLDVEPGDNAEAALDRVNLLIEHVQEPGRAEQVTGVGKLPAPSHPKQRVSGALEGQRGFEGDVIHRRARHHDDVERLDVVIGEKLLLPLDVVKLVEEGVLLGRRKRQHCRPVFVGFVAQEIYHRIGGVFPFPVP